MLELVVRSLWVRRLGWLSLVGSLAAGFVAPGCGSHDSKGGGSTGSGGEAGAAGAAGQAGEAGALSNTSTTGGASNSGGTSTTGDASGGTTSLPMPSCGDGTQDSGEDCDDGNRADGDGCDSFCQDELFAFACGDAELQEPEQCDDANLLPGDGCDASCRSEACGNERLDAGEECDPPVANDCSNTCLELSPNCGDNVLQEDEYEQCDDGNDVADDGCHECRITCGNGRVDGALGEDCEPQYSPGTCSDTCKWLPVCGDGLVDVDAGEECDPSNDRSCVDCKKETVDPGCDEEGAGGASPDAEDCPTDPICYPSGEPGQLAINGEFATDATGWAAHSSFITLNTVSEGVPTPLALELAFAGTTVRSVSGAFQCLPIEPGSEYQLTADYLIPSDTPDEVTASVTVLLYAGTACEGTWVRPPGNGPNGRERGAWTPYEWLIDTATLGEVPEGRMLLRLNVAQPPDVTGSRVAWDNVSLTETGSLCGDCAVDSDETCDDGNQTAGDGCSPLCTLETCGNGELEGGEQCDDGDNAYALGDECNSACRFPTACDACSAGYCNTDPSILDDCWNLPGEAEAGPGEGKAKSLLCTELRSCVLETACDQIVRTTEGITEKFLENCYCGTAGDACFNSSGSANGSCKAEVEAALESDNAIDVAQRFSGSDPDFPITASLKELLSCERANCADCAILPSCGNGHTEDRDFDFVFTVGNEEVPCSDDLTATGRGCSFEECDDGNLDPGDGCDEYCFKEACGNHVTQAGETCDDGNLDPEDGCDACQATFNCGDSIKEPPAEECDPPGAGTLCSMAEFEDDETQCGCDSACKYTVCGNGIVQEGEQCDPPEDPICGDDCQFVGGGPCDECIQTNPYTAAYSEAYCDSDPLCYAVKRCILQPIDRNGHQEPCAAVAAECYCGIGANLDECEQPTFEPTGPCVEEIRAAVLPEWDDNQLVLENLFSIYAPSGWAMLIVETARESGCAEACGF